MSAIMHAVSRRPQRGHTLLELMIALLVGMFLVLGAFSVMAAFEGNKRSTTAVNDALQAGNYGLFTIDKLVRSAGTGLARYAAIGSWGCGLNFVPTDGTSSGTTINSGSTPQTLPAPFDAALGSSTVLRLAPVVVFPGATKVEGNIGGSTATSDAVMMMLGGSGYGEAPVPIQTSVGQTLVKSNVGFVAGDWVLVGAAGGSGSCMITKVASTFSSSGNNVSLPLADASVGSATGLVTSGNYVVGLGGGQNNGKAAAFVMYGVGAASDSTHANALWSLDLLNSTLASTSPQALSDDVVLMRAVYLVGDPTNATTTMTWTNPVASVTVAGHAYDYSPAGLLAGTSAADQTLKSIRAVRVALIVRAPLNEKNSTNLLQNSSGDSVPVFAGLATATQANTIPLSWKVPTGNFRYREIETTIPVRNGLL